MGEVYRGESRYSEMSRADRGSDVEIQEHLDEMNRLLARLIEQGGDLPAGSKQVLRAQIQAHLAAMGLKSLEDYAGLEAIYQRLHEGRRNLPEPKGYPDKEDFQQRLTSLYRARGREELPGLSKNLRATQVAKYGQGDWSQLEGRSGKSAVDYLYDLGKVMSSELA